MNVGIGGGFNGGGSGGLGGEPHGASGGLPPTIPPPDWIENATCYNPNLLDNVRYARSIVSSY